jgi:tagatose 6-phosphate kinase
MIITVTMNPAIDKTYTTDGLVLGVVNRMKTAVNIPGGKGINVSKILKQYDIPVVATGLLGGYNGKFIEDHCKTLGIQCEFVKIMQETRSSINVIGEDGYVTEILEPGPVISESEKDIFLATYKNLLKKGGPVVIAGSVSKGIPEDFYKTLIEMAHLKNVKVFLDSSGELLAQATMAAPYLIKPNLKELEYILGQQIKTDSQIRDGIMILLNRGIEKVVVSLGSKGVIYGDKTEILKAKPPKVKVVNTVGCGDSVVACYVLSDVNQEDNHTALKRGIAISAAHATTMENGQIPTSLVEELMEKIEVKVL